jgi:hypothetical protein
MPRPWQLTWPDVDPRTRAFDAREAADALDIVRGLLPAVASAPIWREDDAQTGDSQDGDPIDWRGWPECWTETVTGALVERFGLWALGWRWARDEGEIGGGPVVAWCCPFDSLTTPQETADRVLGALADWYAWLIELAGLFEQLAPPPAADASARQDAWERATVRLITAVADRTDAGDAWYRHCRQVLCWFLVSCGETEDAAQARVGEATSGVFLSWIAPPEPTVDDVARHIADRAR